MKTGRNDTCPCGSGKKFKRCCILKDNFQNHIVKYNKKYNRYESTNNHQYKMSNHQGFAYSDSKPYLGKIKCRLMHEAQGSIIIPDYIFLNNGWIQPLQFSSPILFKLEDEKIVCDFYIDIQNDITLKIRIYNDKMIQTFEDKSQLFECEIFASDDIEEYVCGEFEIIDDKINLKLYHHTNENSYKGIFESKILWSSRWNYRGNKECINNHFAYFTHIGELKYSNDLVTVAMSQDGNVDYMTDSFVMPETLPKDYRLKYKDSIYTAEVYRATTKDRNKSIAFYIPIDVLDIKHLYIHHQGDQIFYEICFPYIHRIKLKTESKLPFNSDNVIIGNDLIVNSEYSIMGDARTKEGLAAPFEEEETNFIFKIEDCGTETILDFWFKNQNQDLFSTKNIKVMEMKEVDNNPTK